MESRPKGRWTMELNHRDQNINKLTAENERLQQACKAIAQDSANPECTMKNIRYIVETLINPIIGKAKNDS